jgi:FlaA1/EpsC-like NDP-sugar epimerase
MKPIRIELRPGTKSYEALLSLQQSHPNKALSYIVALAVTKYSQQHGNEDANKH